MKTIEFEDRELEFILFILGEMNGKDISKMVLYKYLDNFMDLIPDKTPEEIREVNKKLTLYRELWESVYIKLDRAQPF
jgi:hypothetical protein